jgi:LDH2 family malate/lactate/ureidoglycolate dehydrogenase
MSDLIHKKANPERLKGFVSSAFRAVGMPAADADLAAEILVDADLRGIESHGVLNLPATYIQGLRDGTIKPTPEIRVEQGSPTTVSVNGDNGLGLLVSHRAMQECLRMAEEYGTGWATVSHSNHSGAGAFYVRMAAARNMIGLHWSTGGPTVAAPGGKGRLIGNNVMAFAAPAGRHAPFVLDMAPTMAIANKLHMLQWAGKPIPEGWAIDREGRPITDPDTYFSLPGAILPLGSTAKNGVHKGFGLLMIVDILSGMLSGDGGSMLRKTGEHCHAFCALRIDAFPSSDAFAALMEEMIDTLHATPTVEEAGPLRYPGERGERTYAERCASGIPLRQHVVDDLRRMSEALGLSLDRIWQD